MFFSLVNVTFHVRVELQALRGRHGMVNMVRRVENFHYMLHFVANGRKKRRECRKRSIHGLFVKLST